MRVTVDATADAPCPDGTLLGTLILRTGEGRASCDVVAGCLAELLLDVPDNRFFRLSFRYARQVPCTIRSIRFEQL